MTTSRSNRSKKYVVGNPKGLRDGIPIIIRTDGKDYYEGDVYEPLPGADLSRLLTKGYLTEEDAE